MLSYLTSLCLLALLLYLPGGHLRPLILQESDMEGAQTTGLVTSLIFPSPRCLFSHQTLYDTKGL